MRSIETDVIAGMNCILDCGRIRVFRNLIRKKGKTGVCNKWGLTTSDWCGVSVIPGDSRWRGRAYWEHLQACKQWKCFTTTLWSSRQWSKTQLSQTQLSQTPEDGALTKTVPLINATALALSECDGRNGRHWWRWKNNKFFESVFGCYQATNRVVIGR